MFHRSLAVVAGALAALVSWTSARPSEAREPAVVVRVVDGDTVRVLVAGREEPVRLISLNTPETVDPRRPVECFGREAAAKARELLPVGVAVQLEADASQGDRDRYGRLIAAAHRHARSGARCAVFVLHREARS